jgi:hypothetical protein
MKSNKDLATYQTDYQSTYFEWKGYKYGKCEDCDTFSVLDTTPACADYHSSGSMCCYKYVCAGGCTLECSECKSRNYIYHNDGYAKTFSCWNCDVSNDVPCLWWGNTVMESCRRYCNCSIEDWDGIVIGKKYHDTSFDTQRIIQSKDNMITELKNYFKSKKSNVTSAKIMKTTKSFTLIIYL